MLEGSVEDDVCEFHAESWATRGRVTHVHQQVVEYHTCLQWKAKFASFFSFLPNQTKPNQTESKRHPCASAGGGISHMPAMKSKIRGFFSRFYQTKPKRKWASPKYISRWWNITYACKEKQNSRVFSRFYQAKRKLEGASLILSRHWWKNTDSPGVWIPFDYALSDPALCTGLHLVILKQNSGFFLLAQKTQPNKH